MSQGSNSQPDAPVTTDIIIPMTALTSNQRIRSPQHARSGKPDNGWAAHKRWNRQPCSVEPAERSCST
ncbi:MAG: hypothetical protein ACLQNE_10885 [Thermoguttaceae bacterium]